jgi:hypothetical protein
MGDTASNLYGKAHRRVGAGFQGFAFVKHYTQGGYATPVESPEGNPAAFSTVRAAALQGFDAFVQALPASPWGAWFDTHANTTQEREQGWHHVKSYDPAA